MNSKITGSLAFLLAALKMVSGVSQYSGAEFLLLWPGARATGLAGAYSAVADDAFACFYNQAGLAFQDRVHASLQHCNWLPGLYDGMYYEYAAAAWPMKFGTAGVHVIYMTTGATDVVDFNDQILGTFRPFDLAVGLNWGRKFGDRLALGCGWKLIYSYLAAPWIWDDLPELEIPGGGRGTTFAFDAGLIYAPARPVSMSFALQNMGPGIRYTDITTRDPLPFLARLGVKASVLRTRTIDVLAAVEVTKVWPGAFSDTSMTGREKFSNVFREAWKSIGVELSYFRIASVRVGYFTDPEGGRGGFTYGFGVSVKRFALDLGIDQDLYRFETSNNKFALSYIF